MNMHYQEQQTPNKQKQKSDIFADWCIRTLSKVELIVL